MNTTLVGLFAPTCTREEIRRGKNAFAQTAVWLRDAGFDAVEFHFAHGYLLAGFAAHDLNTRTDEYGGSVENRTRFGFEVVEATRRAVGRDFPLIAKINANVHRIVPGSSQEETNFYVQGLADRGCDAIKISGRAWGLLATDIFSKEDHNFFARDARNIARSVNVPLILIGGVRSIKMAEESLRHNSRLVAFGVARTILAEPDLPNKWQQDLSYDPKCIACNWCLARIPNITFEQIFKENARTVCVLDQNRV